MKIRSAPPPLAPRGGVGRRLDRSSGTASSRFALPACHRRCGSRRHLRPSGVCEKRAAHTFSISGHRNLGHGIGSRDIAGMADGMVRRMLANRMLTDAAVPPQVIVGSTYFRNRNPQRPNSNIPADQPTTRLRTAANGRIPFVDRKRADMVAEEHGLKRERVTEISMTGPAAAADSPCFGALRALIPTTRPDGAIRAGRTTGHRGRASSIRSPRGGMARHIENKPAVPTVSLCPACAGGSIGCPRGRLTRSGGSKQP